MKNSSEWNSIFISSGKESFKNICFNMVFFCLIFKININVLSGRIKCFDVSRVFLVRLALLSNFFQVALKALKINYILKGEMISEDLSLKKRNLHIHLKLKFHQWKVKEPLTWDFMERKYLCHFSQLTSLKIVMFFTPLQEYPVSSWRLKSQW